MHKPNYLRSMLTPEVTLRHYAPAYNKPNRRATYAISRTPSRSVGSINTVTSHRRGVIIDQQCLGIRACASIDDAS